MSNKMLGEDPTSFISTGIPRGDPRRYQSRGIMRMNSDKTLAFKDQRLEVPQEAIQTEGERQLKRLFHSQLKTDVSLESELTKKKEFKASASYQESQLSGKLTYEEYVKLSHGDRIREELKACGLTEEEIQLKLEADDSQPYKKKRRLGIEGSVLASRIAEIDKKILEKKEELSKPDKFAGRMYMSRHDYDLEQSISHDKEKAKLLACLMTNDRPDSADHDPNDPINNLEHIWSDMRHKAREEVKSKRKKRKKKQKNVDNNSNEDTEETYTEDFIGPLPKNADNMADQPHYPHNEFVSISKPLPVKEKCITHAVGPQKNITPQKADEIVPEEAITRYRLTLQQIKELPRFKEYDPGESSKVLYLKNLAAKVTEDDLVSLFGRYDLHCPDKIHYKLLKGRMKGQAFITFPEVKLAAEALNLVNGYNFKGKPIIIEFGHKTNSQQDDPKMSSNTTS